MDLRAVATVLEEATSIARSQRVESSTPRLYECLASTCPGFTQQRLELGKRFFDGIEIGGVGRQVNEFAAPLLDELPSPRAFVRRKVVHHHYLPRLKRGGQHPLRVGLEDRRVVVEPSTARHSPIPSAVMLASKVTFAPQLRGTRESARSPRLDQAYRGPARCWRPSRPRTPAAAPPDPRGHQSTPGRPQPLVSL